jgi:threonine dehydratase
MDSTVSILAVQEARRRIAPHVRHTPLVRSTWLSKATGADVWLKLETLQPTSAFKVRGAFNAALRLLEEQGLKEERDRGGNAPANGHGAVLVTASAGNHGMALATAAAAAGLPCVVFTPADAPKVKLDKISAAGAQLFAASRNYDDAERAAKEYAAATGGRFISPYTHPDVIAGGGTVACELLEDVPRLDAVVVPMGGGGLISGIGVALASLAPACRLIGVEAAANAVFFGSRAAGHIVEIPVEATIADGLGGNLEPGAVTFDYVQRHVRDIVVVAESAIRAAIGDLAAHDHLIVEGAAAVGVAALATGAVPDIAGRTVAVVLTGANIDRARLVRCLQG